MRLLRIAVFTPAAICFGLLFSLLVFAQPAPNPEANSERIGVNAERIESLRREAQTEYRLLRAEMNAYRESLDDRLRAIERILYALLASTGGVGAIVGVDKLKYYRDTKKSDG